GGDGGKGAGFTDANCNVTDPAASGMLYGGGGGGGNGIGSTPGSGYSGYALISWGDSCADPTELTAIDIELTSAVLNWTENGTANTWNLEWDLSGFTLGTGNTEVVIEKPYLLEGLTPATSYDYFVQAVCGGTGNSTWVGPFTFQTEEELGTEANTIAGFTCFPNPMNEVLYLGANSTLDNVIIYTISGKKVLDQNIGAATTEINVSNLSPGIYLMKVISKDQTGIYKLIKN